MSEAEPSQQPVGSEQAMQSSIKSTFEQHHNEIQRRSQITQQGIIDDKKFTKVQDATDFDFHIKDQQFIVFSISQKSFAPVPVDLSNPAVCIYGCFPTNEEAVEFAHEVIKEHGNISVFVDTLHKWITAVKDPSCLTESYVEEHKNKLLKKHQEIIHSNLKEFEENVKNQTAGSSSPKKEAKEEGKEHTKKGKSHKISNKLDIRGQKLAVVSFVKDTAEIPEFLFQVYGFFEKEDDANTYVRNVCGDKVEDFDIDVISTCEWVYPQNMNYENANKEIFRSEELDKIMQNHRNQPKEVAKFKEAMKEDNNQKLEEKENEEVAQVV